MKLIKLNKKLLILSLIIVSVLLALVLPTDPDLGFHIRIGERFWQERSLPQDIWFNYSFPEGNWVAHELIAEVLMFLIYKVGGFPLLALIFSLLMLGVFYVLAIKLKPEKAPLLTHLPLAFLVMSALSHHAGVRLQILAWLGSGLIYWGYKQWKNNQAWPYYLWLIIFLIWANLHNSLIFGLGLILLIASLNLLLDFANKNWLYWFKILFIGIIASFLQSQTYKNYLEFWQTLNDSYKVNISEWAPTTIAHETGLILILALIFFFLILFFLEPKKIRQLDPALLIIAIILFLTGMMNVRNVPLALIGLLPVFSQALSILVHDLKYPDILAKQPLIWFSLLLIFNLGFLGVLGLKVRDNYRIAANEQLRSKKSDAPYQAVQYLKKYGFPKGRVLNSYNYGGYLIYHFPKYQWFIDGRLPHQIITNPLNQTKKTNSLKIYTRLTDLKVKPEKVLNYYQINWTFLDANEPLTIYLKLKGWSVYYEDDEVTILVKD